MASRKTGGRKTGGRLTRGRRVAPRTGARRETRKVGYAVVGLGHIAQSAMLPAFVHARKNSRLVALVTGDPAKQRQLGKKHGVPVFGYDDFEECLALPEVDAVYIALPNHQHAEFAIRAARAGVHVLCEKPMATSELECREMIRECEENDVRLMVAYRLHFDEANLAAVEAVRQGKVGEPRMFTSSFSYQVKPDNIRVKREVGGGALWDIGIYCLNAARYLFRSEPVEVSAFIPQGDDPRFTQTEEGMSAMLRFQNGRLATFNISFGAEATARYELAGTEGTIHLENAYEYQGDVHVEVTSRGRKRRRTVKQHDQFAPELVYFSDCVLNGRAPEPDGWEGLADVRVITALYESARTGRPVRVEPVKQRRRPTGAQRHRYPAVEEPRLVHAEAPSQ